MKAVYGKMHYFLPKIGEEDFASKYCSVVKLRQVSPIRTRVFCYHCTKHCHVLCTFRYKIF
jgi:hypothetical protein